MLVPQANFKLLLPVLILGRPLRIVFPVKILAPATVGRNMGNILQDLARLDDALDLIDNQGADTHYNYASQRTRTDPAFLHVQG